MLKVGTCGFAISRKKYYQEFSVVELNNTFYSIPDLDWIKKLRKEAPNNFEFTFKAFQGITHDIRSPTWKKSKIDYKKFENKVGNLRPTKEVFEFWEKMLEISKILDSKIIIIQLPKSFNDSEENIKNAYEFFSSIKKETEIAIELRGWKEENIKKLCEEFNLINIVDINVENPVFVREIGYYRLHGKYDRGRIIYKYNYSDEELQKIYEKIKKINHKICYVMFNNSFMYENAKKFIEIIKR